MEKVDGHHVRQIKPDPMPMLDQPKRDDNSACSSNLHLIHKLMAQAEIIASLGQKMLLGFSSGLPLKLVFLWG